MLIVLHNNSEDNDYRGNQSTPGENDYLRADCRTKNPVHMYMALSPCKRKTQVTQMVQGY